MQYKGTQMQITKVSEGYFHLHARQMVGVFILDREIRDITVLSDTRFYSQRGGDLVPTGQTSGTHGCYLKCEVTSSHTMDRHLFSREN